MYRIVKMSGTSYAVRINEYNISEEYEEIKSYVDDGYEIILTDDYEQYNATLIIRD